MFHSLERIPASRIWKLDLCYGCGRWEMHIWKHRCGARTLEPIAPMVDVNTDLRRLGVTAPWRLPVKVTPIPGTTGATVTLDCGHAVRRYRSKIDSGLVKIRCRECAPVVSP